MAHTLNNVISHARLRGYCVQVESGLEAVPELAAKSAEWQAVRKEVVDHRVLAEGGGDALIKARAVNRVRDAAWDALYTEGAGLAFLLSGKKADQEPYATVFRVPAKRATSLGHAKATDVGTRAVAEARRTGDAQLAAWAERFEKAHGALTESGRAMEAAEDALDDPRFGKRAIVRKINALIATTEAFVLTAFPGRAALADAILVPAWARRGGKDAPDEDEGDDTGGGAVEPGGDQPA